MFSRKLRALADNPITDWLKGILNFAVAVVAVLTLLMKLPILPPDIVAILVSIMAILNTIIEWLKLLIPAQSK